MTPQHLFAAAFALLIAGLAVNAHARSQTGTIVAAVLQALAVVAIIAGVLVL